MAAVLGVDSSTQSCKVELRDADNGRLLGTGSATHPPTHPPVSEQDPDEWWSALVAAVRGALADAGLSGPDVVAMSVAAQCHGAVLTDRSGRPLRAAKLWNDTTSAPQAARLVTSRGARWWAETTGSVPTAAFTVTKLAWLAEHEAEVLRAARRIVLPHDWLTATLCGRWVTDRSEASGTGYWSPEQGWLIDLLAEEVDREVDWVSLLPQVLGPAEVAGTLVPAAAEALGLGQDVVVGPGAGDQHAAALGLGLGTGDVAVSLGTSGVVMTVHDRPVHDPTGWVDGVADAAGGFLPLVCSLNAAKVTDTIAALLGVGVVELSDLALSAGSPRGRPVLAAYLDGERSPDVPLATGTLAGLTSATRREDVAAAAFDGVVLGLERGLAAIRHCGPPADARVLLTGGGAASPAYRQTVADVLGAPVHIVEPNAGTARGACAQAAAVLAGVDVRDVRDRWQPRVLSTVQPRPDAGGDTAELKERYQRVTSWTGLQRQRP